MKLPDSLLVRYFRSGEIDEIRTVEFPEGRCLVTLPDRRDAWRDLGGGLGYVPDQAED